MTKTAFAELLQKTAHASRSSSRLNALVKMADSSGRAGYDLFAAEGARLHRAGDMRGKILLTTGYASRHPISYGVNTLKDAYRGIVGSYRRDSERAARLGDRIGDWIGRKMVPETAPADPRLSREVGQIAAGDTRYRRFGVSPSEFLRHKHLKTEAYQQINKRDEAFRDNLRALYDKSKNGTQGVITVPTPEYRISARRSGQS